MNLFDQNYWKSLKKENISDYLEFINEVRDEIKSGYSPTLLSENFFGEFKAIMADKALNTWSAQSFYWSKLLERIILLEQIHAELEEADYAEDDETLEDLFNFWNESEYAESLHEILEKDDSIEKASVELVPLIENQIISYFYLNIFEGNKEFSEPVLYTIVPEQGDSEERIYLKGSRYYIESDIVSDIFPTWSFQGINWKEKEVYFEIHSDSYTFPILENNEKTANGLQVAYNKSNLDTNALMAKMNKAIARLEKYTPSLAPVLTSFSNTIVPINEPGIVSYSLQSLPGFSSINMFERDDLDLMDDFLHENGHHYLNMILNINELIYEDDDKIFYSPWRRALRPIRGLYHAYFTFIWAQKLFTDLSLKIIQEGVSEFSSEEVQKIYKRALEENIMLEFCESQLESAYKQEKISDEGYDLYKGFKKTRVELGKHHQAIESKLSNTSEIKELDNFLKERKKEFRL